jgi:hypothetical protein
MEGLTTGCERGGDCPLGRLAGAETAANSSGVGRSIALTPLGLTRPRTKAVSKKIRKIVCQILRDNIIYIFLPVGTQG